MYIWYLAQYLVLSAKLQNSGSQDQTTTGTSCGNTPEENFNEGKTCNIAIRAPNNCDFQS